MSWRASSSVGAGLAALIIAAAPAAAATLVVRASGPSAGSFPPGTAIPDSAKIVLKQNDQIVLLDGRGTRTLKGPGSFSPLIATSSGADARSTFAALVAQRSDRRARVGAVRGPSAAPARPSIWSVDIARSSNVCVADPAAMTIWGSQTVKPDSVTIAAEAAEGGQEAKTASVSWPTGAVTAPWPAALPITSGSRYTISWPGAAQPTSVRFVAIGGTLAGLEDLAQQLIRNGCDSQLDLLIETVSLPELNAASGG